MPQGRVRSHRCRDEALAAKDPVASARFLHRQRQSVHHGLVSQLAGGHPSFRHAARLASRWVSAHLLSNHVSQEVVELIVAAVFYCSGTGLEPPGDSILCLTDMPRSAAAST